MKKSLPFSQLFAIGLMLLSMFLGAGNIIFAPKLGQLAGSSTWVAMTGFLITGVGLVLLAIISLAIAGGKVELLAGLVSKRFSIIYSVLLFLTLGPIYVVPRTTSVVYEVSIAPLLSGMNVNSGLILFVFSAIFIVLTVWLSMNPGKFVDRLGKIITPIFGVLLVILIGKSFLTPMGVIQAPQVPYLEGVFLQGFVQGYYTMDVLAAFVFGGIFIKAIADKGITEKKDVSATFVKAGIITIIGLAIIQLSMAWIGATSVQAIGMGENGGEILAQSARYLFGNIGLLMIATVVFLTGITTNIACLSSVAEYFERVFPKFTYKQWIYILAFGSLVITNFGLAKILELASPILLLLYPISIALIVLSFTHKWFRGYRPVYAGTIIGVGFVAILDAVKEAGIAVDFINQTFAFIPLFGNGAGWIITGLIGAIGGVIYSKIKVAPERSLPVKG
ncbi:branched-chain amino acid transport system II carrier protein [Pseudogracilibacillus auburnensis]|uniref:Branched-chain amino acid transport system carrier protein n=1 Tax=Pseudogracilibacillus auburnensis TaxID=1494959 RepID=A0A2V3VF05_9BACI|nr:branched-chain amino acid transport system II carrier protein [Pseudogracilibacillus auburnensis]PXW80392.1 LIVCS family branched-chain amino acid:cation transporter [Pseudogracilibacillus auburnensis]